ncbi:hypothetical protein CEXT_809991 [Caerostris extrusa]|uniref:Uncharacterized protein n=1 Tax=Caerostris extrusa TaxID=172846 RepID=A0AAV4UDK6_CAEEX|nr:hypothetical protein CEXT_809991 [Caerostris extrusa]
MQAIVKKKKKKNGKKQRRDGEGSLTLGRKERLMNMLILPRPCPWISVSSAHVKQGKREKKGDSDHNKESVQFHTTITRVPHLLNGPSGGYYLLLF